LHFAFLLPEQYTGITDIDILFPLFLRKYIFFESSSMESEVKAVVKLVVTEHRSDYIFGRKYTKLRSCTAAGKASLRISEYVREEAVSRHRGRLRAWKMEAKGRWRSNEKGRENGLAPVEIMKKVGACGFVCLSESLIYHYISLESDIIIVVLTDYSSAAESAV